LTGPSLSARVVLLDIEGTTTPLAFVKDVLVPDARAHVRRYLLEHEFEPEVQVLFEAFVPGAGPLDVDRLVAHVLELMDRDAKVTPLKTLQGLIWQEGYRSGRLRGEVFPDVPAALDRWRAMGRRIAIFSSGSVLAQRLLFGHTPYGDLTPRIDAFFDTTTGSKKASDSYRAIAASLHVPGQEILFVSDVVEELDAAAAVGIRTMLAQRPGNPAPPAGHRHPTATDFTAL
jgi:enolase-phosphatase E1